MTNVRLRSDAANLRHGPMHRDMRCRPMRMKAVAAAFSVFALYLAWHASNELEALPADELPPAIARTQGASEAAATSAPARGTPAATISPAASVSHSAWPSVVTGESAAGTRGALGGSGVAAAGAVPQDAGTADLVKRGEYLARAGDCIACHTADKSRPFAGGLPIGTPFGTLYTPNITPDPETGIGRWTDGDFVRAMQQGIGKGGEHLYPAFPYAEYTRITERDVLAIRAYLNTVAPVRYTPPRNELSFPFNQRWLMFIWNLFNFHEGRFVPDPKQSPQWNRGAYLVEGLAHCEECHTPRNFTQGLRLSDRFSGAMQAGWRAFNITPDKAAGIGNWSDDDIVRYLGTGAVPGRANAAGPMGDVVANSTQYLTPDDLRSIAAYLRSVPPVGGGQTRPRDQWGHPADDVKRLRGMRVGALDAGDLAMVILHGVNRQTKDADVMMPGFGDELNDEQIAA